MRKVVEFYSSLGLRFEYHKHGASPYHYSAGVGETIIEIYPLANGQIACDKHLRLGLTVENFDVVITLLNTCIVTAPTQTEWGFMAVVEDPDGRKVELYKR